MACWLTVYNGAVLSYRQLRSCNSTVLLTSSRNSVYALGFVLANPHHVDPDGYYSPSTSDVVDDYDQLPPPPQRSAPAPFTAVCPARFSAQPGQRLRVALYSFGARLPADAAMTGGDRSPAAAGSADHPSSKAFVGAPPPPTVVELPPSSCPVSVNVRESRDSAPRHDNDICRPQRRRQRHLYTTNGTSVELFITAVDVDDRHKHLPPVQFHRWNFILKLEGKQPPSAIVMNEHTPSAYV